MRECKDKVMLFSVRGKEEGLCKELQTASANALSLSFSLMYIKYHVGMGLSNKKIYFADRFCPSLFSAT